VRATLSGYGKSVISEEIRALALLWPATCVFLSGAFGADRRGSKAGRWLAAVNLPTVEQTLVVLQFRTILLSQAEHPPR